ncbi:MAG: BON domain-containing protein [Chloroflexota bacterium]
MDKRSDVDIQADVEEHLQSAGFSLGVVVSEGIVELQGEVASDEEHDAALDLLEWVPGIERIEDSIEIADIEFDPGSLEYLASLENGVDVTDDPMLAASEGLVYFPPTDPPVIPGGDEEGAEVGAGFSSSVTEDEEEETDEYPPDDEELIERVRHALRTNPITSERQLFVSARRGTVVITGVVQDAAEADTAANVADQVPGVQFVIDRTIIGDPVSTPYEQRVRHRQAQMPHVISPSASWRATVIANRFRLDQMREELEERIADLERDLVAYGVDQDQEGGFSSHFADIATDVAASEQLVAEINAIREDLRQIDEALQRMRDGVYGICVDTGQLIEAARLKANPLAIRTVEAQRRYE